ncbi:mannose-6-phosphate isomerase [Gracilibacillus salitolerans]|uniref:Mannose-6-phosphate isomerase n=1 Tax=Gracilibacillus salitolerans TaxID=2663022 RepID=A0A5Q2TQ08_9BACI|nr:class I mannose-6-phosphate isomerase [Gracilibacillus salitolerans]QGH36207.1 mannose-6-phosphate isomerase [Gracilibacillus salitolerans]
MKTSVERKANYEKHPSVKIKGYDEQVWEGYENIANEIDKAIANINKEKRIITIECYPGVREQEVLQEFTNHLNFDLIINADNASYDAEKVTKIIERQLTDDRVFGVMTPYSLADFFDSNKIRLIQNQIEELEVGNVLIYGVGASLISEYDLLLYADLARWEIQKRYESKEMGNWKANNRNADPLLKYKRGYFFEWRIADRLKKELLTNIDYLMDTNLENHPKMVTKEALLNGLQQAVARPFRVVPYFKPGVWGGQWMKEVCDLDRNEVNYAWAFDCVPEENSLYLDYGNIRVEMPSMNLVYYKPVELLGNRVHARFGLEFPIRFDFLDTMDGQNLSLQVHPPTEQIQEQFGMHYTQDESYYLLDAKDDAVVYLGFKENVDSNELLNDLQRANNGEISFPDEKYINKYPAQKHDHFSIPAGTIHCSGKNCMVLEISSSVYIFTFKLWDWGRVDLDGKPRPVHIENGKKALQWDRTKEWVDKNLINTVESISSGDGWMEEKTGLHEREFIETRRHCSTKVVHHNTNGGVNVLNLVEGEEAIVESPSNAFEPYVVHYAESFIIPAAVGPYTIRPYGKSEGKQITTIKAYVRH